MALTEQLLSLSDAYCALSGLSRSRVSTLVFNHGERLDLIAKGADVYVRSLEKAMAWFDDNWPMGKPWPAGVDRPSLKRVRRAINDQLKTDAADMRAALAGSSR